MFFSGYVFWDQCTLDASDTPSVHSNAMFAFLQQANVVNANTRICREMQKYQPFIVVANLTQKYLF